MRFRRQMCGAVLAGVLALQICPLQGYAQKPSGGKSEIYHDTWIDLNKNGRKDVYEDSTANINARVEDLLSQMNLDEKTCQTATLYGFGRVLEDELPTPEWKTRIWK
ncbi:MAG TPA: hypothetical protein VGI80_01910, partial [Pyrinomonadaceae bacterium]